MSGVSVHDEPFDEPTSGLQGQSERTERVSCGAEEADKHAGTHHGYYTTGCLPVGWLAAAACCLDSAGGPISRSGIEFRHCC